MSKFNVGDKVVPISVNGECYGSNSVEQWIESNKVDCCVDFLKKNGYLIYGGDDSCACHCDECSYGWYFPEYDLKLYEENTIETKTFTREDLKDGMILTLRNGERNVYIKGWLKTINNISDDFTNSGKITQWKENLDFISSSGSQFDIMKVEYMDKVLWEREKQYFTLEEAIETGKRFKHKEVKQYTKGIIGQLTLLTYEKKEEETSNSYFLEQINSKVWEVED